MPLPHILIGAAAAAGLYDTLPKTSSSEQDRQFKTTEQKNNDVKGNDNEDTGAQSPSVQSSLDTSDVERP